MKCFWTISAPMVLVLAAPLMAQTLTGVVDMHAHSDPDSMPRRIDAIDLARLAKSAGERAIVLKNHFEGTASLAYIVRKEVPGIEVFGGICMDLTVGGVNPAAVLYMTKVKGGYGRVVWMPTFDSEYEVTRLKAQRPFARISKDGKLVPEAIEVISLIAKNNLILATGHSSPAENLMLVREAKRQNVQNIIVTHPMKPGEMTIAEMQEAAKMGAYIEFTWRPSDSPDIKKYAQAIRQVGPEFSLISSDLGNKTYPAHTDGLLGFLQALKAQGITVEELDRMVKVNPAKLLGLNP
jgi:hypothetical protein